MKNICVYISLIIIICAFAALSVSAAGEAGRNARFIHFGKTPDFIADIYYPPDSPLYKSQVLCYNGNINHAKLVLVFERLLEKTPWGRGFMFYENHFLGNYNEDAERICRMLPLVKRTEKYGRYEFLQYEAKDYMYEGRLHTEFSVIKDNGRIIWFQQGESPGDIRLLDDGRYMIATPLSVFYVRAYDNRIVAELYAGARVWPPSPPKPPFPEEVKILTDNVVSLKYASGTVEHWKVRLSEEDVAKNAEKNEKNGGSGSISYAEKNLLWSNGGWKGTPSAGSAVMWCYHEGGPEPAAESYSEMSYEKTVGVRNMPLPAKAVSSSAAGNRPAKAASAGGNGQVEKAASANAANSAGEARTGFFASLFGRIKTFFAGLFA